MHNRVTAGQCIRMCWRDQLASLSAITKAPVMVHQRRVVCHYRVKLYGKIGKVLNPKFGIAIGCGLCCSLKTKG